MFTELLFYAYYDGIHQVRILVFDNPKVSSAFKRKRSVDPPALQCFFKNRCFVCPVCQGL